jgi:ketosteroid isomerase-like protein
MNRLSSYLLLTAAVLTAAPGLRAQTTPAPLQRRPEITPLPQAELTPGQIELMKLEVAFAADVAKRGGKAFSSWFAEDGVELSNGKPALLGLKAITTGSDWDPKDYQLSWYPIGAQMGASGDTGFTWGHFDATYKDAHGKPVTASGRYITFWKKVKGEWKVALDAGADEAPPVTTP